MTSRSELLEAAAGFRLVGDVDGDGDLDLFLGRDGDNELWLNNGTGHFTKATTGAPNSGSQVYTRTSAWADMDGDGALHKDRTGCPG